MRLSKFLYFCFALCLTIVFIGACMNVFFFAFRVQIFPAPEWHVRMQGPTTVGFVVAVLLMMTTQFIPPPPTSRVQAPPRPELTTWRRLVLFLGSLLFAGAFATGIQRLPVWVAAKLWGHEMELGFIVAEDPGFSDSKCPNAVRLTDAPILFDKVCGMSKEAQMSFAKGDPILIWGQGTAIGLIGESARHP